MENSLSHKPNFNQMRMVANEIEALIVVSLGVIDTLTI